LPERTLTLAEGRRLAVQGALLSGPRPDGILDVVERLGRLQIDPTNAVARSELLVLWSRLGTYDVDELERLRWEDRHLIKDRDFVEDVFGFAYRLEIYVPEAKRRYGYYVLPVLHGDRLIGRVDARFDRRAGVFRVNAVFAEPHAPPEAGPDVAAALDSLAGWVGADRVEVGRVPPLWRDALS
jgi:uncharacterized protein YcaQ